MTMEKRQSFIDYLLVCYYDEVFGVSLFGNLEKSSSVESERCIWIALKRLEEITKERIKLLLDDFGVDVFVDIEKENIQKGIILAKQLETKSWCKLMSDLFLEVEPYLEKYRDAKEFYSYDAYGIIDFIIAHEEAIYYLANKEKNKDSLNTDLESLIKVNNIIMS